MTAPGIVIKYLEPIREKRKGLLKDKTKILDILAQGEKKASEIASQTMSEVRKLMNL